MTKETKEEWIKSENGIAIVKQLPDDAMGTIEALQQLLDMVPEEHKERAFFVITTDDMFSENPYAEIGYDREETDEEYSERMSLEAQKRAQEIERSEREQLARLLEKYGDGK